MRKRLPKIIMIVFTAIFILQMAVLFFLFLMPSGTGAAEVEFIPQITVGDFKAGVEQTVNKNTIGNYIKAIYNYGIGVVGIIAAVVMMYGGLVWLTAGGDSGRVSQAKEWIKASLYGLILALLSYTILLTVNPDLVSFKPISIDKIKQTAEENSYSKDKDPAFNSKTVNYVDCQWYSGSPADIGSGAMCPQGLTKLGDGNCSQLGSKTYPSDNCCCKEQVLNDVILE